MGIVINKPCELDLRALLKKLNLGSQGNQESLEFQNQYIMGSYTTGPRLCFA